jgi:hypothetical protein
MKTIPHSPRNSREEKWILDPCIRFFPFGFPSLANFEDAKEIDLL